MKAEFYLLNRSFSYQEGITLDDLESKIKNLDTDYSYIRTYKETEKIYKHESIYSEPIFNELTVEDLLYYGKGKGLVDRDTLEALRRIIDVSENINITPQEVIDELLDAHSQNTVFGLLCLHSIEMGENKGRYLVYDKNNWLDFHQHFLGLYPISNTHFCNEASKYFPNLFFHERVEQTVAKILNNFVKTIIVHLKALNNDFRKYQAQPYSRIDTLKAFSIGCKLDEEASNQGNSTDKPKMTFSFLNHQGLNENICCEPHLKLCKSDNKGDNTYYQHRIYFHEGKENISNNKILVGHIGEHIKFLK
jgi:hypothetical protein